MPQDHALTWGSLTLSEPDATPDATDGYVIHATSDGTNLGNPSAIVEIVQSLLTDGALARVQGWGNREAVIRLRLSAPAVSAGPALAAAEAALMANVLSDYPPPLVWTPPATSAATTVFDVVVATLDRDNSDGWDVNESLYEYRYFLLTLTCLPFARAEEKATVAALTANPGSPTTSTIDACTSATNWSKAAAGFASSTGPTVSSGAIVATGTGAAAAGATLTLTRTAASSMASLPYLKVAAFAYSTSSYTPGAVLEPTFTIDGTPVGPVAIAPSTISGNIDYYFETGNFTTFAMAAYGSAFSIPDIAMQIADLTATDTLPVLPRQRSRTLTISGSAPTTAALRLYSTSGADLGDEFLIYTTRDTLAPNLRRDWYVAGSTTSDTDRMSGSRSAVVNGGTDLVFRVPVNRLTPGTYAIMANLQATSAADLTWAARLASSSGATSLVGSDVIDTQTTDLAANANYRVETLGQTTLPPAQAEGTAHYVQLTFTNSTANTVNVDEVWLFNLDTGALTWVRDASLGGLEWVEIRSPELSAPRPAVYGSEDFGATAADVSYMCESFGTHRFYPGVMQVFTACQNATDSVSEAEFYPRFHSNVQG